MRFLRPANDQRTFLSIYVGAAFLFCISVWICPADGQEVGQKIQQHLDYGEFPAALQLANSMDESQRDHELQKIATAQMKQGAPTAAYRSIANIRED